MAFLALIPIVVAITEVVEAAVVVGAVATTAYVGVKAVEEISDMVGESSSRGPITCFEQKTIYDWWGNGLTTKEYSKLEELGYDTRITCFPLDELKTIIRCEAKVGKPTKEKHGYEQDENWDGKTLVRVPNNKSKKRGYPDKHGNVWVPNDHMHGEGGGEPGWDVQHKDGRNHHHVHEKNGKVRTHPKKRWVGR